LLKLRNVMAVTNLLNKVTPDKNYYLYCVIKSVKKRYSRLTYLILILKENLLRLPC